MATKKPATKRVATKTTAKKTTAKVATAKSKRPAVKKAPKTAVFSLSLNGDNLKTQIEGNADTIAKMLISTLQDEPSLKPVFMMALTLA
jgi:hypothetical protein